jgi:hypothetical protein
MKSSGKATDWKTVVLTELIRRDMGICQMCSKPIHNELIEVDHIMEKADGGRDELNNLRIVHLICHKLRHNPNHRKGAERRVILTPADGVKEGMRLVLKNLQMKLIEMRGNLTKAAPLCGMSRFQALRMMKKFNLSKINARKWEL